MVASKKRHIVRVFFSMITLQIMLPALFLVGSMVVKFHHLSNLIEPDQKTVQLVIDDRDPNVVFHGDDEMTYKGHWFDIKKMERSGHNCTIAVVCDEEETGLTHLSQMNSDSSSDTHSPTKKVLPFLFLFFEQPPTWVAWVQQVFTSYSCNLSAPLGELPRDVAIPPPLNF